MANNPFANAILKWFKQHGRHDLPWQKNPTPYRVWLSEIMLQQTQVNTVIPYFHRFFQQFSSIKALAHAELDQVLALWSGLGYYARARNLHKTAQIIHQQYHGRFPKSIAELMQLPGIGKSTAGAILSLSMNIPATILDGNVKRIITRYHAFNLWPGSAVGKNQLWKLAAASTPKVNCKDYNQAMMDLGAIICLRANPKCRSCPLTDNCQAYLAGEPTQYPIKKPKKKRPIKKIYMLIFQRNKTEILLEKRPNYGIWGGLWSFPESAVNITLPDFCRQNYQCKPINLFPLKKMIHQFTHFILDIQPWLIQVKSFEQQVMESYSRVWYNIGDPLPGGIPKPIHQLIATINEGD